jgi:SAM-dependent methyltransferase
MATFSNHFGKVAGQYADFRPRYPEALYAWLADQCQAHALAWDCGCGNGQASVALAEYVDRVHATDASAEQIAHARPHPRVDYAVAPAQDSGLSPASVDLITVAQALHWFDRPAFYAEVRRVARPGAVIAAWTYGVHHIEGSQINATVRHFYEQVVGPFWPQERRLVETAYRQLDFPFARLETPEFDMQVEWTLAQLLGYLRSWSATARFIAAHGKDPVDALTRQLAPMWGDPERRRQISWPLGILAGRVN